MIEQRLEDVMVEAVNDGDPGVRMLEGACRLYAAESRAEDNDLWGGLV
jgi:hypothetical protein